MRTSYSDAGPFSQWVMLTFEVHMVCRQTATQSASSSKFACRVPISETILKDHSTRSVQEKGIKYRKQLCDESDLPKL